MAFRRHVRKIRTSVPKTARGHAQTWLPAAALLAAFALLAFMARFRLIDGDEGYIGLAGRLVTEGEVPYLDFLFLQMPYLAYFYAAGMELLGNSWTSMRFLAWAAASLLGALIYLNVSTVSRSRSAATLAVILYGTSALILSWLPITKAYAPCLLAAFAAYAVLFSRLPRFARLLLSGLFLGLAAGVRLYMIGILPVFLIYALLEEKSPRKGIIAASLMLAGAALALAPATLLFFSEPHAFLFNNLGSHALRSGLGLFGDWGQKSRMFLGTFLYNPDEPVTGLQMPALILLNILFWRVQGPKKGACMLASAIAATIVILSLLPSPSYTQYFCICVPFLITAGALRISQYRLPRPIVLSAAIFAYAIPGGMEIYRTTISGKDVQGITDAMPWPNWRISTVREVGRSLDLLAKGEPKYVISWWPGYFIETSVRILNGMENDSRVVLADKIPVERTVEYHILREADVKKAIRERRTDLVVLGNGTWPLASPPRMEYIGLLMAAGYRPEEIVYSAEIFALSKNNRQDTARIP